MIKCHRYPSRLGDSGELILGWLSFSTGWIWHGSQFLSHCWPNSTFTHDPEPSPLI